MQRRPSCSGQYAAGNSDKGGRVPSIGRRGWRRLGWDGRATGYAGSRMGKSELDRSYQQRHLERHDSLALGSRRFREHSLGESLRPGLALSRWVGIAEKRRTCPWTGLTLRSERIAKMTFL
jgi:hypothetical protein